jgi:hypothetical protein
MNAEKSDRSNSIASSVTDLNKARAQAAKIDPAERARRSQAVEFARASVGLEGFTPSAEAEALAARFIDSHIDLPARPCPISRTSGSTN